MYVTGSAKRMPSDVYDVPRGRSSLQDADCFLKRLVRYVVESWS